MECHCLVVYPVAGDLPLPLHGDSYHDFGLCWYDGLMVLPFANHGLPGTSHTVLYVVEGQSAFLRLVHAYHAGIGFYCLLCHGRMVVFGGENLLCGLDLHSFVAFERRSYLSGEHRLLARNAWEEVFS